MVSQSTLQFTLPFSSTPIVMPLSLSDLAGHSSFVFLAISYLETDFMQLRMFAVSGVALSIVFQYYREKPLWIPIRWNSVFLLINVMMILLLLKEENDANNIPPEKKAMFESFEKKGMKPVEFLQLITAAKRMEVKKGDTVVSEKLKNTRVYFVKSGQLSVMKNGSKIRTIERNQFTGEMSFLRWENRIDAKIYMNKHQKDTMKQWSNKDSDTELFLPLLIACENLLDQLGIREKPQVTQVAIESQLGGWSRQGSSATTTASAQTAAERELHNEAAFGITVDEKGNVVESSPAEPVSNELQQQNEQTVFGRYLNATYNFVGGLLSAKAQQASDESSPQNAVDGELAAATVVAEEDCVLYFWSFKSLRSLIELYPSMGLAFERALSDDLNRKMVTTMQVEPKQRYQLLLSSAVMDGEVSQLTRRLLWCVM
jgi:CRP-like cAMP-binding protein